MGFVQLLTLYICFLPNLGNFQVFLLNIFFQLYPFCSLSGTPQTWMLNILLMDLQVSEALLVFFISLFSFCFSDWRMCVVLSVTSLILSCVLSIPLLNQSSKLFILVFVIFSSKNSICSLYFPFVSWDFLHFCQAHL